MTANTAPGRIMIRLFTHDPRRLATHELAIEGYSENCLATRLPELAKQGLVEGRYREGESFKEWAITDKGREVARQLTGGAPAAEVQAR